jgi:hypothetical protein
MLSKTILSSLICGSLVFTLCAFADDKAPVDPKLLPPASSKKDHTYEKDIQPILEKSCYPCHGPKTAKPKGKLRLDTLEALLKGGEDGPALIKGDSAKSSMVAMISFVGDPDEFMPPPKNRANAEKLTKEQVGLVRAWIDQGAK